MAILQAQHTQPSSQPRIKNTTDLQEIQCDTMRIQQLIVNALFYAQQRVGPHQPVFLNIQKTTLAYPIPSIKDYIKEIPALCMTIGVTHTLPQVKSLYMGAVGNASFQVPQSMEDLPLLDNQHIVDAHYGAVEFIKEDEAIPTQFYVIPTHLRTVRPSMMDLPQMEVGSIESGI